MAISGGDGSIILTTSVDTSGISKGSNTIKTMLNNIGNSAKQTGVKLQSAFVSFKDQRVTFQVLTQAIKDQQYAINSLSKEYAELVAKGKGNSQQAQELRGRIEELTAEMKDLEYAANSVGNKGTSAFNKLGQSLMKLASYLIGIQTVFKFINFSKEAGQAATQQEANVQRLIDIYGEAAQSVGNFIDANARGIGLSRSMATSVSATYGNLLSVWADQETNARLTNDLLNQTAVVASKTGRTVEDVSERIRSGLLGNTEAIEDLGINVNIKTIEITDAFKRIADGRSWQQLSAYEQAQVRTLAILEQSTKKYGTTVAQTSAFTRQQYRAAYEDMQATWGQFVNAVLLPVLRVVTQIMNIITAGLRAIAGITGKTIESTEGISSSIGGAVDNQNDLTDAIKGTNKELKKSIAGFDEIQILSSNATGGADIGAGAVGGGVADLGLTGGGGTGVQEEGISTMLATIMGIVGGAMVALGVLLIFNGHIGWGIGFIIAGAATMGVSMAAIGDVDLGIAEKFSSIMAIVGGFILAIGIVLLLKVPSAQPLALGMIIAGAGVLAVGVAQMAANKLGGDVKNTLHGIITIVSGVTLAIGIILLCFGQITPLSIGLVVTGAVGLATEIALYPDEVKTALQGWVGGVLAIVSGALLVLGIVLCVCGIVTPLSIGMIVVGAVGLVAELALNWNYVTEQVTKFFNENSGLIVGVSLALLVIGIILCFTGVGIPLAIGLIVVGAAGLAAEVALNWKYISKKVTSFFKENSGLIVGVSIALIVLGIILLFTGVGIPLAIGLIVAGGGALAAEVALNWNFIVDKVKEVWGNVKQFWNDNIAPVFTAEWWLNLAKKCGNGLIDGFEGAVNGIIGMFEKMINWIVDGLNKISFDVPEWVPGIGGKNFGFNISKVKFDRVSIPPLAQGAVIPPNREFLAVLGDQKKGTNIEAPADLIKQMVMEGIAETQGNMQGQQTVKEEHYYLNQTELMSVLYKLVKGGERIQGNSLVKQGGI